MVEIPAKKKREDGDSPGYGFVEEAIYSALCIIHCDIGMAKTVAVKEETWEKMKRLLEAEDAKSFDELIRKLMDKSLRVPASMFGVDRKSRVKLTLREHEEITRDAH